MATTHVPTVDRYVAAVLAHVPRDQRAGVEVELRRSIAADTARRLAAGQDPDEAAAEREVLTGLGDPIRAAADLLRPATGPHRTGLLPRLPPTPAPAAPDRRARRRHRDRRDHGAGGVRPVAGPARGRRGRVLRGRAGRLLGDPGVRPARPKRRGAPEGRRRGTSTTSRSSPSPGSDLGRPSRASPDWPCWPGSSSGSPSTGRPSTPRSRRSRSWILTSAASGSRCWSPSCSPASPWPSSSTGAGAGRRCWPASTRS